MSLLEGERVLSYLYRIGKITEHTPYSVISFLLYAHGIKKQNFKFFTVDMIKQIRRENSHEYVTLIKEINEGTIPAIRILSEGESYTEKELKCIRIFTDLVEEDPRNPKWSPEYVISQYEFIVQANTFDKNVGYNYKENPCSYNTCILYALCLENKIQVSVNDDSEEMYFMLRDP